MERDTNTAPGADSGDRQTRFGDYVVLDTVGHGGFATVFRGEFRGAFGFRKQVALKVLQRRFEGSEERATRDFLNEARLGATIRHPNLVEFYECGRVGDRLYIAMELIDGPNLAQVLNLGGELPYPMGDDVILAIAMQVARGLKGLHAATVDGKRIEAIHRDLKPANILLSSEGQAKITDYGITRFAADFYQTLDNRGPRGSPLYMSPEQARGEALTQASDVFSFGSTVLEMITGRPVFAASTIDAIVMKVREAEIGDTLAVARRRIPQLVGVLENCMLPDPASRYADGAALVEGMRGVEPPPFGEELIGRISSSATEYLRELDARRRKKPVEQFWCLHSDLERLHERSSEELRPSVETDELELDDATVSVAVAAADSPRRARRWALWLALPAIGLLGLTAIAAFGVVVARAVRATSVTDDGAAALIEVADAEVEPPLTDDAGPAEAVTAPPVDAAPPTPEAAADPPSVDQPLDGAEDGDAAVRPDDGVGAGPPRLFHEPITRGIRGNDIRFTVSVEPAGNYTSTVWYRAVPDGDWQRRNVVGGDEGALTVVIPAGVWLSQDTTDVEYFIEVGAHGGGGLARNGSAVKPYRFRLY